MNGFGELPVHGLASAAKAASLRAEAQQRSRHHGSSRPGWRYVLGSRMVAAGDLVMGRRIELTRHATAHPDCAHPA